MVKARRELPKWRGKTVRIPEGKAVATHPGLCSPSVMVHATGPSYEEKAGETREESHKIADDCLEDLPFRLEGST